MLYLSYFPGHPGKTPESEKTVQDILGKHLRISWKNISGYNQEVFSG
jgi:hypothetical protein